MRWKLNWWTWLLIGVVVGSAATSSLYITTCLREPMVRPEYVALVELSGTIAYSDSPLSLLSGDTLTPSEVEALASMLRVDPTVKAVVLVINSPGGSASASEEIYGILRRLSEEKVVVSYIAEYGASGGYYIALPSREIVASPSSLTGSVGAVSVILNWKELMDKIGVKSEVFKSGIWKDIGSSWREMSDEERKILASMIDSIAEIFKKRVLEHRDGKVADWNEVFTARPYTGVQALEAGLVDRVGTLEDAIERARELSGLPETAPVKWVRPPAPSLLELLLGGGQASGMRITFEVLLMWPLPDFSGLTCIPDVFRAK